MRKLTADELKKLWIKFFTEKGHAILPSAPLVPENDATVLFTTAGMHPLVPFLLGEKHPAGKRLANFQKCFRTGDIDEVGDASHCTFFEMLGNWSLGDYFKKEAIAFSFEFLTDEKWLGIPKDRLAVSVFEGDKSAPRDDESALYWKQCGMRENQIYFLPKKNNWWDLGSGTGPCGPDTEMFFITDKEKCGKNCSPACDCGRFLEIWNDVFMEYTVLKAGDAPVKLKQKNVDTGMGVERTVCVLNGVKSVYDTGSFKTAIDYMAKAGGQKYDGENSLTRQFRIIADHMRASVMLISDDVRPSNSGQGYVLRRLLRRALNHGRKLKLKNSDYTEIAKIFIEAFKKDYKNLETKKDEILLVIKAEIEKFDKTLQAGAKEFEKLISSMKDYVETMQPMREQLQESFKTFNEILLPEINKLQQSEEFKKFSEKMQPMREQLYEIGKNINKMINGKDVFRLLDTYGFPFELTKEMAEEAGFSIDEEEFKKAFEAHQALSRAGGEKLFKGGLSDTGAETTLLHTATHLLLAGLRELLGKETYQRGSNITPERLRLDFNCERKLTDEELKFLEDFVNKAIKEEIEITCEEMTLEEAKSEGALGIFDSKYGEVVKVYTIGKISREICGGPHAKNTKELKNFKILKEESSSAGIRRIKAVIKF